MDRLGPTEWWNTILRHFANASVAHASSAQALENGDAAAVASFRRLVRQELQAARQRARSAPKGWHDVARAVSSIARDVESLSVDLERATREDEFRTITAALRRQDERLEAAWLAATRLARRVGVGLLSPAQMTEIVRNAIAEVA